MEMDRDGSSVWTIPADGGEPTRVTSGPFDVTPSWTPDGARIVFAAPADGRRDADLYLVALDGGDRRVLVSEPLADETGPRFSADGRFLFATAVRRSPGGDPVLSSVVYLDRSAPEGTLRALQDVALRQRLGPALAPEPLYADRLNQGPPYDVEELRRSLCGPGGVPEPRPAVCKKEGP
jgi:Tol biopolymer transport system component